MMNLSFPQQTPFQGFSPQSASIRMMQVLPPPQPTPAPSTLGVKEWYLASLKFDAMDNSKIDGSIFDPRPIPGPQPLPQPMPIPMSGGSPWGGSGVQVLNPMGGLTMGQQPMSGGFSASPLSGGVPMAGIPMTSASPFGSSMASPFGAPMASPLGSPLSGGTSAMPFGGSAMGGGLMPNSVPGMMPSSNPYGSSMPFGNNPTNPSGYPGGLPGSLPGGYPGLPGQQPQGLPGLPGSGSGGDQGLVGLVMTLLTEILGLLTQITGKGKGSGLLGGLSGGSGGSASGRVERDALKNAVQEFMRNQASAATANTRGQSMSDDLKRYLSSRFTGASDWQVELPYISYQNNDGSREKVNMKDLMNGTDSGAVAPTEVPSPYVSTAKTNTGSTSAKAKAAAKTTVKR